MLKDNSTGCLLVDRTRVLSVYPCACFQFHLLIHRQYPKYTVYCKNIIHLHNTFLRLCTYRHKNNVYTNTSACNTQIDRNNNMTAEDVRTRQAGRRERQRQTLVTGEDTPSLSHLCEQTRPICVCVCACPQVSLQYR